MRNVDRGVVCLALWRIVAVAVTAAVRAEDVQALYDKKCKLCHSIKGEGGKQADKGGPLDGVGAKRDRAWLEAYLTDPKSKMPDAKMPKFKYTPEELKAFVDFLSNLK